MGLLYQERVLNHWHFKLAYAPSKNRQEASELHQAIYRRLFPNAELQLKEMGSSRCKKSQDRFEFTSRLVRYVDEHMACAHIDTVDGKGYEDRGSFLGVAFVADLFCGANAGMSKGSFTREGRGLCKRRRQR